MARRPSSARRPVTSRPRWRRWLVLLVAAGGCQAGGAGVERAAVSGGADDAADPAVVAIGERRTACDAPLATLCSGTLIAPRVVLTAAHCFAGRGPTTQYETFAGPGAVLNAGELHHVVEVKLHPMYDPATHVADLALLLLDAPSSLAPARLRTAPLDASLVGQSLRVAGFGASAPGSGAGVKRQGLATISAVDADTVRYQPGPALTCEGDSGGPGFVADAQGEALAGVTATGDPGCAQFGLDVRVDPFVASFIQPYLDASAALPAPAPPSIAPGAICRADCASDADCPSGLACSPMRRCVLGALPSGSFGASCASAADCAQCLRLDPGSDGGACRCYVPCPGISPPPPGGGSGCVIAARPARAPAIFWILLLAIVVARSRRMRRCPGARLFKI